MNQLTALAEHATAGPWDERAACRGIPGVMDVDAGATRAQVRAALDVCGRCTVLDACRDWALTRPIGEEVAGVCGGLTAVQRAAIRNRTFTKACETCGQTKPLAAFRTVGGAHGGHGSTCLDCTDAACPPELTCRECGQTKPADRFGRDAGNHTGRNSKCNPCRAVEKRAKRATARAERTTDKARTTDPTEDTMTTATLNGTATTTEPAEAPEPAEPAPAVSGDLDGVIERARRLDDKAVRQQLDRTVDAIARLRELVATAEQRQAAQAEVEELEAALAAARDRARQLGGTARRTTARSRPSGGRSAKEVRAWAKENGIECNEHGRIPAHVQEQFDAAHPGREGA